MIQTGHRPPQLVFPSPEEAGSHFGWLGAIAGMDVPASSALTQQRLAWRPTEKPGFIADLERSGAFGS